MNLTLADVLNGAIFTPDYDQMVLVKNVEFYCMMMRGVEKQHSTTATWAFLGEFRDNAQLRNEFMAAVNSRQP
jgi:GTP cyclohydrolase I